MSLERVENGQFTKSDIFDHPVSFSLDEVIKKLVATLAMLKVIAVLVGYFLTLTMLLFTSSQKTNVNTTTSKNCGTKHQWLTCQNTLLKDNLTLPCHLARFLKLEEKRK